MKNDDYEETDFYYAIEQSTMEDKNGKEIPVVHMGMVMENGVESKLYQYITSEEILSLYRVNDFEGGFF